MKAYLFPTALLILSSPASAEVLGIGKESAQAVIIDTKGLPIGKAKATMSKKHGLQISVNVKSLTRGERAIHIHTLGSCEGPKFTGAGPHWNPAAKLHGMNNMEGPHAGDLPNLLVGRSGKAKLKFDLPDAQFKGDGGLMDGDGAAIVIHAQSDDGRTDPSGNSGDRIACGVFVR